MAKLIENIDMRYNLMNVWHGSTKFKGFT